MKNIINVYLTQLMQDKRQRRQATGILLALALVVAAGVLWGLKVDGIAMTGEASCGMTEHSHTEECYDADGNLICGMEEHIHTADCYSDPSADAETEEQWAAAIPTELSGDWASDIITVANSQLGYQESTRNYALNEDVRMGYSRYGAWYGNDYGDWDGMFVSFCLSYANVPETSIPRGAGAFAWSVKMKELNVYTEGNEGIAVGDIVFLNRTEDAQTQTAAIVTAVNAETAALTVIEGDCDNQVMQNEYAVSAVTGYCAVAKVQNPQTAELTEETTLEAAPTEENVDVNAEANTEANTEENAETIDIADESVPLAAPQTAHTQTAETENYIVTASYNEDAMLSETAVLNVVEYAADSEIFQQRKAENGGTLEWLLDIGFYDGETEVEPSAAVTVSISFKDETQGAEQNLTHFAESGMEVYQNSSVQYGRNENGLWTMTFQTNSFSPFGFSASEKVQTLATFGGGSVSGEDDSITPYAAGDSTTTITWQRSNIVYAVVTLHYVDEEGNALSCTPADAKSTNITNKSYDFDDFKAAVTGYSYANARLNANEVTSVKFQRIGNNNNNYRYNVSFTGAGSTSAQYSNSTLRYDVYLVYEKEPVITTANTGTFTFKALVDGNWETVAEKTINTSYEAFTGNDGNTASRFGVPASVMQEVYGDFGYTASSAGSNKYVLAYGDDTGSLTATSAQTVGSSSVLYYPIYPVTQTSGTVYYVPKNTASKTAWAPSDEELSANKFYTVKNESGTVLKYGRNEAVNVTFSVNAEELAPGEKFICVGSDGTKLAGTLNGTGTTTTFTISQMTQSYTIQTAGALTITDDIKNTGNLLPSYSTAIPSGAYYVWSKNTSGAAAPSFADVTRKKVTGSSYNVAADGSWLNIALDDGALNDNQTSVQYTVRLVDANGNTLAASEAYDVTYWNSIQNGGFETPNFQTYSGDRTGQNYVTQSFYNNHNGIWQTTASGSQLEIINRYDTLSSTLRIYRNYNLLPESVVNANTQQTIQRNDNAISDGGNYSDDADDYFLPDGDQFAELNAENPGALYQDVLTNPGDTMYYQFYHRGRGLDHGWINPKSYHNYDIVNDENLAWGQGGETGTNSENIKDEMYVLIMSTELAEQYDVTTQAKVLEVIANIEDYPGAYVQTVISDNMQWHEYNDSYTVPSEQYLTRYFFVAGEIAAKNYNSARSVGNLLDKISFSTKRPDADPGTATITVDKTITGLTDAEAQQVIKKLTFTLTVSGKNVTLKGASGDTIYTSDSKNVPENTLVWNNNSGNWKGTFTYTATIEAAATINYSVTENTNGIDVNLYERTSTVSATDTVSGLTVNGTLQETNAKSASYVNAYVTNSLLISKTAKNYINGESVDGMFTFDVTVADANGSYDTVDANGTTSTISFTDGKAAVSIAAGDSIRILGLPTTAWTVTETNYDGYTPSYKIDAATNDTYSDTAQGTIGIENAVAFTNTTGPELPKTGGIGTWSFYLIGGLLAAGCAGVLLYRRRHMS